MIVPRGIIALCALKAMANTICSVRAVRGLEAKTEPSVLVPPAVASPYLGWDVAGKLVKAQVKLCQVNKAPQRARNMTLTQERREQGKHQKEVTV